MKQRKILEVAISQTAEHMQQALQHHAECKSKLADAWQSRPMCVLILLLVAFGLGWAIQHLPTAQQPQPWLQTMLFLLRYIEFSAH